MPQPFVAVPSTAANDPGVADASAASASAASASAVEANAVEANAAAASAVDQERGSGSPRQRIGINDFGPLAPFMRDEKITDMLVNGEAGLWIDRGSGLTLETSWNTNEHTLRELAVRLIGLGGRHIDEATPCVDVRLHDGVRVHAVLPPISATGTLISIRLPRVDQLSLADLRAAGMYGEKEEECIRSAVRERRNILVTGAAGSGKTTLLGALLAAADIRERIVAIEDVAELRVDHPHFIALESRQANLEGAGAVGVQRLLREALRMRPDRLVLGECRGGEVRELFAALNTGHDGGAGTLHANSLHDVPARLEALGALADMSPEAVARQAVSAIGLVIHLEQRGGIRLLAQMGSLALGRNDRLEMRAGDRMDEADIARSAGPRHRDDG